MNTCFGCGEDNPDGLQLGSAATIVDGEIRIPYRVPEKFAGFKGVVHGGIVAALMDEAMGLANTRVNEARGAVTASISITFKAPVKTEVPIEIRASSARHGRRFDSGAWILDEDGRVLAEATSVWVIPNGD